MTQYAASLLLRQVFEEGTYADLKPLWEESIVLIDATSPKAALESAESIGKTLEIDFELDTGVKGHWKFERVSYVHVLDSNEFRHGSEIFWRYIREETAKGLLEGFLFS